MIGIGLDLLTNRHDLHKKAVGQRAILLAGTAQPREQGLGPPLGIVEYSTRLGHIGCFRAILPRGVRMNGRDATQEGPLDRRRGQIKARLKAESVEGVSHGRWYRDGIPPTRRVGNERVDWARRFTDDAEWRLGTVAEVREREERGMCGHLGIVGVSPEGAALFIQELSRRASRVLEPHEHPRITLHNEPLAAYVDSIRADDWHAVAQLLSRSARKLAEAGATFCLTPDQAVQYAIPLAAETSPIPWMSVPELVADAVEQDGISRVGLLGTRWVTQAATYQSLLGMRGVQVHAPEEDDARMLDTIIFGELVYGGLKPESRGRMLEVVSRMLDRGCEGLILGMSEGRLAIDREGVTVPIYDASAILAQRAVEHSMRQNLEAAG